MFSFFLLRDRLEQRFEVAIDKNAAAGSPYPAQGGGYRAAMIDDQSFAHAVLSTGGAVEHLRPTAP